MDKLSAMTILIVLTLAAIFGPLITLWVLNTLFALALPYTFKTWLAALLFNLSIAARGRK